MISFCGMSDMGFYTHVFLGQLDTSLTNNCKCSVAMLDGFSPLLEVVF